METKHIRNFSIIAHIDHGKSTLADRMLEMTGTIERRKMKEQVLDSMDLERERGITIKMAPVRMIWTPNHSQARNPNIEILNKLQISNSKPENESLGFRNSDLGFADSEFILNLIDTPGHIDFSYEVSRALKAVEGAVLLVDATQGVQAQTLTTLNMAREQGLAIIPAVSKIDSSLARVDEVVLEVAEVLQCDPDEVLRVSGKTGEGVEELLRAIVEKVPTPSVGNLDAGLQALIFDFTYSNHKGIIIHTRIFSGQVHTKERLRFMAAREEFITNEVGVFAPEATPAEELREGEIGYIVTGIKQPGVASVGDTITHAHDRVAALSGYRQPQPVVWASVFPESQDDLNFLRQALEKLRLSDASLSYEEESSGTLGRGFRCGFLGMLHLEIVTERLKRESNLSLVVTTPSITYEITHKNGEVEMIYSPALFPDHGTVLKVREPWVRVMLITPPEYVSALMQILHAHEADIEDSKTFGDLPDSQAGARVSLSLSMPLRELMAGFFDTVKNMTSGYASLSYELGSMRDADVARLDILVADEPVTAFARVVSERALEEEARKAVEKLYKVLPRQLFAAKIQARAKGRIIASETLKALRKDVTGYLYGGDITRKMKLLEKQKRGKKKMLEKGRVNIPHEVFLKMVKG